VRETSTPFFCAIFTSPICQDRLVVNTGRAEEKDVFCAGYPVEDNQSLGKATTVLCQATLGKKMHFLRDLMLKRSFYQDRLGTNMGNAEGKRRLFTGEALGVNPERPKLGAKNATF